MTVAELRAALAHFADDLPIITGDDSMGTFDDPGVVLRLVLFSKERGAVKFLDHEQPPGSGPEKGEDIGWEQECEADGVQGLYLYPDAE